MFTLKVREQIRKLSVWRATARPTHPPTRMWLEALEDRTLPSASAPTTPAIVAVASPPPVPSFVAITSYVESAMSQWMQLLATVEQDIGTAFNALGQDIAQEVSAVQQQWDHLLGITPPTNNPSLNTSVTQPNSDSGAGRGNASGSGSGSGATTANNASNQTLHNSTQQSGSGSGGGGATTTHANTSLQGSMKAQPMTGGTGSVGSGTGSVGIGTGSGYANVGGQVWLDNDGDGSLDNGELGYQGMTVELLDAITQNVVQSTTTNGLGVYTFQPMLMGPEPEPYFVHVDIGGAVDGNGFSATYPGSENQINNNGNSLPFLLKRLGRRLVEAGLLSMTVTTTQDDPNGPIQNQTTLRDAIQTGNNGGGPLHLNKITFYDRQAGQPLNGTISLQKALDPISRSYDISGPTATTVTVEGGGAANPFRIFKVNAGVTSTISNLRITGGYVNGTNGGGIDNAGTLTLANDNVFDNQAAKAGVAGGNGGGIANEKDATLTLDGGEIYQNSVGAGGGGIANAGTLYTTDGDQTGIYQNSAQDGGGIASGGDGSTAKIVGPTTIYKNFAADRGGGVAISGGTVTITGPGATTVGTISGNKAASGGGIYVASGVLSLQSSVTVNGNNNATTGNGGGMYLAAGTTTGFYGVTVSGNSAPMNKVVGVAYEQGATLKNAKTGLTDADDPGGNPVQV